MPNDIISRQTAIASAISGRIRTIQTREGDEDWIRVKEVRESLIGLPPIDAVPVVRCKDCKHWGMHKRLNVPWCFEMHIDKSEEGYCDSGERRE